MPKPTGSSHAGLCTVTRATVPPEVLREPSEVSVPHLMAFAYAGPLCTECFLLPRPLPLLTTQRNPTLSNTFCHHPFVFPYHITLYISFITLSQLQFNSLFTCLLPLLVSFIMKLINDKFHDIRDQMGSVHYFPPRPWPTMGTQIFV